FTVKRCATFCSPRMRPTSAPPSSRASFGPGSGFPIESPIDAVSLGMAASLFALSLLELLDESLQTGGGGLDALRRFLGTRRSGFGAVGGALGAIGGVVGCRAADRRGA